jgi:hypothetical protein
MTAQLFIHLTEGLTAEEISTLAKLGRAHGRTVETEIMEALRGHVRRNRRRIEEAGADPAAHEPANEPAAA